MSNKEESIKPNFYQYIIGLDNLQSVLIRPIYLPDGSLDEDAMELEAISKGKDVLINWMNMYKEDIEISIEERQPYHDY